MPKKIEHHLSMKFNGIGCQISRGLSDIHAALKQELADTLSTIPDVSTLTPASSPESQFPDVVGQLKK